MPLTLIILVGTELGLGDEYSLWIVVLVMFEKVWFWGCWEDSDDVKGRKPLYTGASGMDWISFSIPWTSLSNSACSSLKFE